MLNDDEIKDFVEAQVPKNTKQQTKTDLDIFTEHFPNEILLCSCSIKTIKS